MAPDGLLDVATREFHRRFNQEPTLGAWAPGRLNLIGDHTDYSGGLAMPCAIDLYTVAVAAPGGTGDGSSRVFSAQVKGAEVVLPPQPETAARGDWADYLRGVRAGYAKRGVAMPALDILINGNLPLGSGLSSSASLELCFANLVASATGARLSAREMALLCQTAEHDFAGVPCGILDQFAIACGRTGQAMIIDCRDQRVTHTSLPDGCEILVLDSGVRHDLSDGSYAQRRQAVTDAETELGGSLRHASLKDITVLQDPELRKRAMHVISENQRVPVFADALAAGEWQQAGEVMLASHRSLTEDFDVSCAEIDWLVRETVRMGAFGARMTGGGFGGSVVCLAPADCADTIDGLLRDRYADTFRKTGALRRLHAVGAAQGRRLDPH